MSLISCVPFSPLSPTALSIAKRDAPVLRMLLGQVRRTLSSISFSAKRRAYSDRPGDVSHSAIVDTILALGGIPAPFPSRLSPCHSLIRCERFSSASRSCSPVMPTTGWASETQFQALRNRTELGVDLAEKKKPTTGRSQVAEIAEHDRHPCIWPPAARTPMWKNQHRSHPPSGSNPVQLMSGRQRQYESEPS